MSTKHLNFELNPENKSNFHTQKHQNIDQKMSLTFTSSKDLAGNASIFWKDNGREDFAKAALFESFLAKCVATMGTQLQLIDMRTRGRKSSRPHRPDETISESSSPISAGITLLTCFSKEQPEKKIILKLRNFAGSVFKIFFANFSILFQRT